MPTKTKTDNLLTALQRIALATIHAEFGHEWFAWREVAGQVARAESVCRALWEKGVLERQISTECYRVKEGASL